MKSSDYSAAVNAELSLKNPLAQGARGMAVQRVQEWLAFHSCRTGIDGAYGSATAAAVRKFQKQKQLSQTGEVDQATWQCLTAKIHEAFKDGSGDTLGERVRTIAQQHLNIRPVELGGNNCGPWVRIYTGGHDGADWAWCAGFVTSVLRQACMELGLPMPIRGSLSCDTLAAQAQAAKLFVTERDLSSGNSNWNHLGKAYIFLARRTAGDWTHTGFGFGGTHNSFDTIEGNSNNEGSRDGFEVCDLTRSAVKKDFIVLQ